MKKAPPTETITGPRETHSPSPWHVAWLMGHAAACHAPEPHSSRPVEVQRAVPSLQPKGAPASIGPASDIVIMAGLPALPPMPLMPPAPAVLCPAPPPLPPAPALLT